MITSLETALPFDAPANSATGFVVATGGVATGGVAHGSIFAPGDVDFIAVDLVAGQSYSFAMVGIGTGALTDPRLRLYGTDGTTELGQSSGGLANGNVSLGFTAVVSGRYYLAAEAVGGATGSYGVAATPGGKTSLDVAMLAGLIDSQAAWTATRGTGATLSFGFAETSTQGLAGFTAFTEVQREAVRAILAQISELTGLVFAEVNPGGTTDAATLLYGNYDAADGLAAQSGAPGDTGFGALAGDVWINSAAPPGETILPGGAEYLLLLHQIGHSLGLTHPGLYADGAGGLSHAADAQVWQDSLQFTVMSGFGADEPAGANLPEGMAASGLLPQTLGLADMAALHQIYGANIATRAGNDCYGFGSNLGGIYDFSQNYAPMLTIWDGGGRDKLDLSGFAAAQLVRLEAGSLSSVGGLTNNLGIAFGTLIEDAKGGRGADTLLGNSLGNLLEGMAGADSLEGGGGKDSLYGGSGADTLRGGAGNDLLVGEDSVTGVVSPAVIGLVGPNGAGAHLELAAADFFYADSFTLEMLCKELSPGAAGLVMRFGNLELYRAADGSGSLRFVDALDREWATGVLPPALTDGAAHRLSISYENADGRLRVYLDGALSAEVSFIPGTRALTNAGGIWIGGQMAVGDLRIFDTAQSAQDIWDNALTPLPDPLSIGALMQYWQASGTSLANLIPSQPAFTGMGALQRLNVSLQDSATGNWLFGGTGDDTYRVYSAADQVVEAAGEGNDLVLAFADFALGAGQEVERLTVAEGAGGVELGGNELANRLQASKSHADTLMGGGGNDLYHLYHTQDQVIEAAAAGNDTIIAHVDHRLAAGSAVEGIEAAGSAGLTLYGNGLATRFLSNAAFADTLYGGGGSDLYVLRHAGDRVIESAGGGRDTIEAWADHALAAGSQVEMIIAMGSAGRVLTGNALANSFTSNAARADTLIGGAGNDRYSLYNTGDRVIESAGGGTDQIHAYVNVTLAAGSEVEMLYAKGSAGRSLTGNALANGFISNAAFADTLKGGAGNDRYYVKNAADRVIETTGGGTDAIYAAVSYRLAEGVEVEELRADAPAAVSLTGNSLANRLYASLTRDDTLSGGAGDDRYYLFRPGQKLVEGAAGGYDRVYAATNFTLGATAQIEELVAVAGAARKLTGNGFDNRLVSLAGQADTLAGGAGNDSYVVNDSADQVVETKGRGTDVIWAAASYSLAEGVFVEELRVSGTTGRALTGNSLGNALFGGIGRDSLMGGAGSDSLTGGRGQDQLYGGVDTAVDRFIFTDWRDSTPGAARDVIHDFALGRDKIDLHWRGD